VTNAVGWLTYTLTTNFLRVLIYCVIMTLAYGDGGKAPRIP
jgi:hypothetical protein